MINLFSLSLPPQAGSAVPSPTEMRYFLQDIEGVSISSVHRNTQRVSDHRKVPLAERSRTSPSSASFLLCKDNQTQLEDFQALTSQTLPNVRSALYNPKDFQSRTQTTIQALSQEEANFSPPLPPRYYTPLFPRDHMKETLMIDKKASGETECKIEQLLSKLTTSASDTYKNKKLKRQEIKDRSEIEGGIVEKVKSEFGVAPSEEQWEQTVQRNSHICTPKYTND